MSLLECLIGITLSVLLLNPLLKASAHLATKQMEYEKTQLLISEAERGFVLMGRAIRMAGFQNAKTINKTNNANAPNGFIQVNKKVGYRGSDSFSVQHQLSDGIDYDCIGNILSKDRTRKDLAFQGFVVERQAGVAKGVKVNGGSLICQSLDRHGRLQNTTLMNGVNQLLVEEITAKQDKGGKTEVANKGQRLYKVSLQMTDGERIQLNLERIFATRNLP